MRRGLANFGGGAGVAIAISMEDTSSLLRQKKWIAGLAGVVLLIVDVVTPVTSSIFMVANGILFGWVLGTLLLVAGGTGAALVGFWIGIRGERPLKSGWPMNCWTFKQKALVRSKGFVDALIAPKLQPFIGFKTAFSAINGQSLCVIYSFK